MVIVGFLTMPVVGTAWRGWLTSAMLSSEASISVLGALGKKWAAVGSSRVTTGVLLVLVVAAGSGCEAWSTTGILGAEVGTGAVSLGARLTTLVSGLYTVVGCSVLLPGLIRGVISGLDCCANSGLDNVAVTGVDRVAIAVGRMYA